MRVLDWAASTGAQRRAALERPVQARAAEAESVARHIVAEVRSRGDEAVRECGERFDGVRLDELGVTAAEIAAAERAMSGAQMDALDRAIANVRAFHAAQAPRPVCIETVPGVLCERLVVPVRAVGLYVPAGSAPLPSTALMLAVPAALAGCPTRILCTPPDRFGRAHPAVLAAAHRAGIERIFKVGGAQAIAAMAYGTTTIPKCDKIFGPGNAWVTSAKMLVGRDPAGAAIDLPAGPSEVLIIADETARADFIAADLLAQAEHAEDAHAVLVTTSASLADRVVLEVERQRRMLSRATILERSVPNMRLLLVATLEEAFEVSNEYAPEHLLIALDDARRWLPRVRSAGAVFLGVWSPETVGDYCSGPNHTLPTYGHARAYSGLGIEDFQKRITVQELSPSGLRAVAQTACTLAALEGLDAHGAAVSMRLAALDVERDAAVGERRA